MALLLFCLFGKTEIQRSSEVLLEALGGQVTLDTLNSKISFSTLPGHSLPLLSSFGPLRSGGPQRSSEEASEALTHLTFSNSELRGNIPPVLGQLFSDQNLPKLAKC